MGVRAAEAQQGCECGGIDQPAVEAEGKGDGVAVVCSPCTHMAGQGKTRSEGPG